MDWPFISAQYGNIASVLGLVISVAGFFLTLREVRRARTASEQAQEIAREALNRVSFRLFFTQLASSVRLVQELREACRQKQWARAIDRCEQLRVILAELVENQRLDSKERDFIVLAIDDLSLIIRQVEDIEHGKKLPPLPGRMMDALGKIATSLSRINGRLTNQTLEVQHGTST